MTQLATRQLYWNISWHWLLYPLLVAALALFAYGFYRRWRLWRQGRPGRRRYGLWAGLRNVATFGLGQRRILDEFYPGVTHLFIFWGALLLLFATIVVALQADLGIAVFRGDLYLFIKATANAFGLLALAGIAMAAWRRYVTRPPRLDNTADDAVSLALLAAILVTGFLVEGARMAAVPDRWAKWGFVGDWLAALLAAGLSSPGILLLHRVLWWFHLALVFGLIAYLPYSKLFHLLLAPANQFMGAQGILGVPDLIDFEDESVEGYGASRLSELPRKTLFEWDACLRCGRCQDICPATASGKHLNPKNAVRDLRLAMERAARAGSLEEGPALAGEVVPERDVWSCTTCRACEAVCPVFVGHVDKTLEMRRNLTLMESRFPAQARLVFDNLEVNGNPLGESALVRGDYLRALGVPTVAEDPEADILFWPGCTGNLDARGQRVSAALVRLLRSAGVGFATLGNDEKCCGEPARRLGNEYLFQELARRNIETLDGYGIKTIVTQCPHCVHTLKNEYRQVGGLYQVRHHTEFLLELVRAGSMTLAWQPKRVAYHDPCYLGRYRGLFEQPRELLRQAGCELSELPRRREKAFCCGGGGGHMWLEEDEGERINNLRADEILGVAPEIAAVACPYCLTMIKDGVDARQAGDRLEVKDISEILQPADGPVPPAPSVAGKP